MNLFNLLNSSVSFSQKATDGLITFVIGMAVVFIGMEILVLCVEGFGKLAAYIANKAEKKPEKKPEEKAESKNENVSEDDVSEETRVAIIAAVAAYYAETRSKNEFTVKKIKKL